MDKKYLNKVVDRLVRETEVDYEKKELYSPFNILSSTELYIAISSSLYTYCLFQIFSSFAKHCEIVYGLNDDEVEYVWEEYKENIRDKVNNG